MKEIDIKDEKLRIILSNLVNSRIPNTVGGYYIRCGGFLGIETPNGWIGTDDNPVQLPEVVVTGHYRGSSDYTDSSYWSGWWNGYNDNGGCDDWDYGGGGGGYSGSSSTTSESTIMSNGMIVMEHLIDSIETNTAIWFREIQETKGFEVTSAASVTSGVPSMQYDLIQILRADQGIIRTLGTAMSHGMAGLNGAVALVGLLDGDPTMADKLAGASALFGTLGLYTWGCPWIGLTCDGISLILGIASAYYQNQEQNANGYK